MFTKVMKWASAALLLLAVFLRSSASFELVLGSVVCISGLLVMAQAIRMGKYLWAAGFVAVAVLFNPVVPVQVSASLVLWLDMACLGAFVASLVAIRTAPVFSAPSITGRGGMRESL